MKVSSTSTSPLSCSRPGRTSTERSRWSIAHAVWYEPISSARLSASAEIPSFWLANSQQVMNHTVSGVRVSSKIVPAVDEVRSWHSRHSWRPSASSQAPV